MSATSDESVFSDWVESVDGQCGLLVTMWLRSFSTTSLRSTSRACARVFVRNAPVACGQCVFLEAKGLPRLLGDCARSLVEVARGNPLSPLRCWRLSLADCAFLSDSDRYRRLGKRLFADADFVLLAVTQNGYALESAQENLRDNRRIVLRAVERSGHALEHASHRLKADKDVVLAAVTSNGMALQHAGSGPKRHRIIVLAAVAQNGHAFQFADMALKSDRNTVSEAAKLNIKALDYATLQQDPSFFRESPPNNLQIQRKSHNFSMGHVVRVPTDEDEEDRSLIIKRHNNISGEASSSPNKYKQRHYINNP